MVQAPTKSLSLKAFLDLPETKPAREYMGGKIIQKPMPQGKHRILQRELVFALTVAFKQKRTAQAFPELRCTFGDCSIVPDIAVFESKRIPRDDDGQISNLFNFHPDWSIEILSPKQSQTKVIRNLLYCLDHGTVMGWLLDPEESLIFVYQAGTLVQVFDERKMVLPVPEFADAVTLTVGEIFDWLKA